MKTIVYISRHSLTQALNYVNENESVFVQNIKTPLSIDGEEKAKQMSNYNELKNIDVVYSSNYSREWQLLSMLQLIIMLILM